MFSQRILEGWRIKKEEEIEEGQPAVLKEKREIFSFICSFLFSEKID